LYATPTGCGDALYKHIYRTKIARVDHAQLTAKVITDIIREDMEKDISLQIKQVRGLIRKLISGVNSKYNKLWRGCEIIIFYIFGSWSGSYILLPRLLEVIVQSNLRSKARIMSDPLLCASVRQFKCVIWAFSPCIEVFRYMRPIISIDVSHLKSRYEGRLLDDVGYDDENQLLPLAFGLVEKENISN
jgi:hypothetical protein